MADAKQLAIIAKPFSILYVEDHKQTRQNNIKILDNFFGTVVAAEDGAEALTLYQENPFDVVLSDINIPHLNGIELVKAIREINPEQVIIIMSAHDDSHYLLDLINLGVEKFLSKPFDLEKAIEMFYKIVMRMIENEELLEYQSSLELDSLDAATLITKLKAKNDLLEKTIKELHENQNINTALVNGIKDNTDFSQQTLSNLNHKSGIINL